MSKRSEDAKDILARYRAGKITADEACEEAGVGTIGEIESLADNDDDPDEGNDSGPSMGR